MQSGKLMEKVCETILGKNRESSYAKGRRKSGIKFLHFCNGLLILKGKLLGLRIKNSPACVRTAERLLLSKSWIPSSCSIFFYLLGKRRLCDMKCFCCIKKCIFLHGINKTFQLFKCHEMLLLFPIWKQLYHKQN